MEKYLGLLGWRVADKVTGFTGIVEHVGVDLYGCVQAVVKCPITFDKETGAQKMGESAWFDIGRLERIGKERIMEPISPRLRDDISPSGPADKPIK